MTGNNGTDDNAFGRDPLGKADITRNFGRETRNGRIATKLRTLSDEKEKMLRDAIRKKVQSTGKSKLFEGKSSETGSLLDDSNILPDE